MMKNNFSHTFAFNLLFLLAFWLVFLSCKKEFEPEESFIKVYNDNNGNRNYFPLSIQRTNDNGYLTLSAYNGWKIHLLKTDAVGDMLWEFDLPSKYVNAVPNLIERNGNLYFVCMDAVGLFTYVMQVDENGKNAVEFQQFTDLKYPLYAADAGDAVYIQNYIRSSFRTGIYKISSTLDQIENSGNVQIFTDVEDKIVDHLSYTGKRFPFFVSVTPEKDYVVLSGFNNYSFSTVFMDANLDFSGVYNGAAFDGGMNAILPLGANKYSLARFSFANQYFNPNAALSPTTIDIAESIPATGKVEIDASSPILIKNISINSSDYSVYLSTTKSNQLLLSLYEKGTSVLKGSKYLGESVPLKAADFHQTQDGGLIILTRVTLMGSFNRIATIKVKKEELEASVD